jgi:hypothetical protein
MSTEGSFKPRRGGNKRVAAGLTAASIVIGRGETRVRVVNEGTVIGWFVCYSSADPVPRVATIADTPFTAANGTGSIQIVEKGVDDDIVSFVSSGTGQVVNFQPGEGGY